MSKPLYGRASARLEAQFTNLEWQEAQCYVASKNFCGNVMCESPGPVCPTPDYFDHDSREPSPTPSLSSSASTATTDRARSRSASPGVLLLRSASTLSQLSGESYTTATQSSQPKGGNLSGSGTLDISRHSQPTRIQHGDQNSPDGNEDRDGGEDGDSPMPGPADRQKPAKSTEDMTGVFSCPYRKRDPLRFNIRDHTNCAVVELKSISQVK